MISLMKWTKYSFQISLVVSLVAHLVVLFLSNRPRLTDLMSADEPLKIRYIGVKEGKKTMTLVDIGEKQQIDFEDLAPKQSESSLSDSLDFQESAIKKEEFKPQTLSKKIGSVDFSNNNVTVDIDLPEGVDLDELNEEELQFFSFHKRTLMQYVSTFYSSVNNFELSNPHLKFPMTKKNQVLRGRISFDRNGNIKRIKVLQWSDEEKLQDFFLGVLKKLEKVPNPPKLIIKNNDEFSITYGLIINS